MRTERPLGRPALCREDDKGQVDNSFLGDEFQAGALDRSCLSKRRTGKTCLLRKTVSEFQKPQNLLVGLVGAAACALRVFEAQEDRALGPRRRHGAKNGQPLAAFPFEEELFRGQPHSSQIEEHRGRQGPPGDRAVGEAAKAGSRCRRRSGA